MMSPLRQSVPAGLIVVLALLRLLACDDLVGPMPFRVDRPFLFVIRGRLSGTVLFLGAVEDLRAG